MNKRNASSFLFSILFLVVMVLGCAGIKKPWRSYEQMPFNAESWKHGDAITRGTMTRDLIGVLPIQEKVGRKRAVIVEVLGQPTLTRSDKIGVEKATVLLYEVDLGERHFMDALQVYIDKNDMVVFANMGVTREKESIIERITRKE